MSVLAVVPTPLIALALVVAAAVVLILRAAGPGPRWRLFGDPSMPLATLPQRQKTLRRIETDYAAMTDSNGKPVDVLFDEAKGAYDAGRDRIKDLDGKATTLLGIVTTGFGAIALLGDPSKTPKNGLWLALGLIALAIAFGLSLLALIPRTSRYPSLSYYVLARTVADPSNAPRIKLDLTEAWLRSGRHNETRAYQKARFLIAATLTLGLGLGALAMNYSIGAGGEKPTPTIRVIIAPEASTSP